MGNIKDLTGQKFEYLTVLEDTGKRKNRQVVWLCECDCGNKIEVVGQALRSGHTCSCGCKLKNTLSKKFDLTNQIFGELTVIKKSEKKNEASRINYWECQCSCGEKRTVSASDLRTGKVTKCKTCTQQQTTRKKNNKNRGPIKNLLGKQYGELVVIQETDKRDNAGRVIWLCKCSCGKEVEVPSGSLTSGNTSSCGHLRTQKVSKGEEKIEKILLKNGINYKTQYSFDDCLSPKQSKLFFDFALLDEENNIIKLIEFDGEQHYKPIEYFGGEENYNYLKECDKIKNNFANQKNIPLQRIKYNEINLINLEMLINVK